MNRITQDSEQGFLDWLQSCGWVESDEDYYKNTETGVERERMYLHGLYIAEQKLKA
jgi:hypothetical protein